MAISEVNRLIEENGTAVYRFCRRLADTREDADDLYQETMLKALEKSRRVEAADNPKNYIIGMAARLWAYQKRRQVRRERIAPTQEMNEEFVTALYDPVGKTPEALLLEKEEAEFVRQLTASLPERMRVVVYMYYTAEMSIQDIAHAQGVPVGTVKSRLFKARKMVKAAMEDKAYDRS